MHDIGRPQAGETVVVSAAAGAVGSVAAQIAKIAGARVVGIAGGPEKCALLDRRARARRGRRLQGADDWRAQLKAATPDGIDVDFENVGGEIMDAVFARLNLRARVALCGLISGYNDDEPPPGPRASADLLDPTACWSRASSSSTTSGRPQEVAADRSAAGWPRDASRRRRPSSRASSSCRTPMNMLFDGKNVGKLVVKVG